MSEKITPALSADDWRELLNPPADNPHAGIQHVGHCDICNGQHYGAGSIAIQNYLLPDDDPRKITHGTVEWLREIECCPQHRELARAFADALESYLPPAPIASDISQAQLPQPE